MCVLDLQQAYVSVRTILPADLVAMIETLLCDTSVTTLGDEAHTWREIVRVMPVESPISSSLFNLFIDPLAGAVKELTVDWEHAFNLFADEIMLMALTADKIGQDSASAAEVQRVGKSAGVDLGRCEVSRACRSRRRQAGCTTGW